MMTHLRPRQSCARVASLIRDSLRAAAPCSHLLPSSPSPRLQARLASDLAIADFAAEHAELEKFRPKALTPLRAIGKHAATLPFWQKDVLLLRRLIDECPWDGKLEKALRHSLPRLSPDITVEVIRALPEAKQALRFFIWISEQQEFQQNDEVTGAISRRWAHEKRFEAFLASLAEWRNNKSSINSDSFLFLIRGYGWAGMMEKAASILFGMEKHGCTPVDEHFNCLLTALAKEQHFSLMPVIFQGMLKAGFAPHLDSFKAIILGFCNVRKGIQAFKVFNLMKAEGFTPDEEVYAMVVDALCKSQRFTDAASLVPEMLQRGWNIAIRTCNRLADGLCKEGKMDQAEVALSEIVRRGSVPNLVTLTAVFNHLCEGHEIEKAWKLWNKINKKRTPTATFQDKLMASLCQAGKYSEAEQIFTGLKARGSGVSSTTYSILIQCFCGTGKMDKACKLLRDMARNCETVDASVYNLVLQGLYDARQLGEAIKLVRKVGSKYCDSKSHVFQSFLVDFCKVDHMDKTFILLDLMKKAGQPMDNAASNTLICALSKVSKFEEACTLLQNFIERGNAIYISTYETLAEDLRKVKAEKEAEANRLLNELEFCEHSHTIS